MKILLTNDDGIDAEGLVVMAQTVARWIADAPEGEVREAVIAAPHQNFSGAAAAVGNVFEDGAVSYERRVIPGAEGIPAYCIVAPPSLCATIGCLGAFGGIPDAVLSGINPGSNVGHSVLHSGTIGAVLTAAQLGIPGVAVSAQWGEFIHYQSAATLALEVLEEVLQARGVVTISLNVPNLPLSAIRGVRRGRISDAVLVEAVAPAEGGGDLPERGIFNLVYGEASPQLGDASGEEPDDDLVLVESGYACVTALQGPRENTDLGLDGLLRASLTRIDHHLRAD
jgi:5'-nucleotidase